MLARGDANRADAYKHIGKANECVCERLPTVCISGWQSAITTTKQQEEPIVIGCLCIHGFTGDPWEVQPVADELSKQPGWLVYTPVLPGHGQGSLRELKHVTYKQWVFAVEVAAEEMRKRCDRLYVIGFSMGGMLASYIAARFPVDKLVLLNAAAYYMNPKQFVKDMFSAIRYHLTGEQEGDELIELYERKFRTTPFAAVHQFLQLVQKTKPYASKVTVPTLIIQGELDGLVPLKSAYYLYDVIGSKTKEIKVMKRSRHMICHGYEADKVIEEIKTFLTDRQTEREDDNEISAT